MILKLFAFLGDPLNSRERPAREGEVQAYYNEHANAASRVSTLKWLIAALLALVGFAAWAEDDVELNDHAMPAVATSGDDGVARDTASQNPGTSPATVFIDGPTGFVFVYTTEG